MRRLATLPAALLAMAVLGAAPVGAQEVFVTGAGAGVFPPETSYLEVSLNALELGMGLGVAGGWAAGQLQTTLIGVSALGVTQEIVVEGHATSSVASPAGTATFSGVATVDPGDGTLPVSGVPFTAVVIANPDGSGTLALTLGGTSLPAATVVEGYMTVR